MIFFIINYIARFREVHMVKDAFVIHFIQKTILMFF